MSSSRLPVSVVTAAAVGTVIGFGGTVALVVQAGQVLGASPGQIVSMITALCLGIGVPGMLLSWRLSIPVVLIVDRMRRRAVIIALAPAGTA